MSKGRLEAFSDAVIAIIMTIMVLELRPPHSGNPEALRPLATTFGAYALSFVYLAIYWNNHHHMLQAAKHVTGGILWANMHLLFWLSIVPFVTDWLGEQGVSTWPVAAYGLVMVLASIAYYILAHVLAGSHGNDSALATALGRDYKGKISVLIYVVAMGLAFVWPTGSCILYVLVALMWLVPDRRFESATA